MPKGRRAWFRVANSVLHEDWSNDELAVLVRLQAHMSDRWARDGKSATDACTVVLNSAAIHTITSRERTRYGVALLRQALGKVTASLRYDGSTVVVNWPKFAEFQKLPGGSSTQLGASEGQSAPAPAPAPANPHEEESGYAARATRLVNLLAREPGSREEKIAFLERNLPLWEAEIDAEGLKLARERNGRLRSLAIRWWRQECKPRGDPPNRPRPKTFEQHQEDHIRDELRRRREQRGEIAPGGGDSPALPGLPPGRDPRTH